MTDMMYVSDERSSSKFATAEQGNFIYITPS